MRKLWFSGIVLGLLASVALAQGDAQREAALRTEWGQILREYQEANNKYFEPYRKAKSQEEAAQIQLDPKQNPIHTFLPRFKAFAQKAGNSPVAADAYMQIAQVRSQETAADGELALDKLTTTFVKLPIAESVAGLLVYSFYWIPDEKARMDKIFRYLDRIQKNGSDNGKAAALMAKASVLGEAQPAPGREKQIVALLDEVMAKYPNSPAAKRAKGQKFEAEFLSVGKPAPDFEAVDENGTPFKLSDYRGKVVVLDFWGFW